MTWVVVYIALGLLVAAYEAKGGAAFLDDQNPPIPMKVKRVHFLVICAISTLVWPILLAAVLLEAFDSE